MVSRPALAFALALACLPGAARAQTPAGDPSKDFASSLASGKFPWYDAPKDAAKPGVIPREVPTRELTAAEPGGYSFGDITTILLMALALLALLVLLAWLYRVYQPAPREPEKKPLGPARAARIEDLPEEMRHERSDSPWAEMLRARDRGDYSRAIMELFVHQLMALHARDLIRLAPGRTARQLVRSIRNPDYAPLVTPTLRQFESVYYGRRKATKDDFDALWPHAQAFEQRLAREVAG